MLKKFAPILAILLITPNLFANQAAQEEVSKEAHFLRVEIENRKHLMLAAVSCLVGSAVTSVISGTLAEATLIAGVSCATAALFWPEQSPAIQAAPAPTSEATTKLAANTDKENNTKSALTV